MKPGVKVPRARDMQGLVLLRLLCLERPQKTAAQRSPEWPGTLAIWKIPWYKGVRPNHFSVRYIPFIWTF